MLNVSEKKFDYSSFEKKLRHYFSDTAPCTVSCILGLLTVKVTAEYADGRKETIDCSVSDTQSVSDNIQSIITKCESILYPKITRKTTTIVDLTVEEKKKLILRGYPAEKVLLKKKRVSLEEEFRIIRISVGSNMLVIRNMGTGEKFLLKVKYAPVRYVLDKILPFRSPEEGYEYLMNESEVTKMGVNDEV